MELVGSQVLKCAPEMFVCMASYKLVSLIFHRSKKNCLSWLHMLYAQILLIAAHLLHLSKTYQSHEIVKNKMTNGSKGAADHTKRYILCQFSTYLYLYRL